MAALLPKELGELTTTPLDVDVLIIQEDASQDVKQIKVVTLFTKYQAELDATQIGAGLEADGTYTQPSGTNYIDTALSLKNAEELLDAQIKIQDDLLATIGGTDKRTLTDAELANVQLIGTTDHNWLTDAELAKLTRLDNESTLVSGTNVSVDLSLGQTFSLLADVDFTLDFPINVIAGQSGFITVTQDATGTRLMTLGAGYVTSGGAGITLSTAADSVDVIEYKAISSTVIVLSLISDVK